MMQYGPALLLIAAAEAISVLCILHLWARRRASLLRKLGWTAALLMPALGPLFYGCLFEPLSPLPRIDQGGGGGRTYDVKPDEGSG